MATIQCTIGVDMIVVDFTVNNFVSVMELLLYFHENKKPFLYCGDRYEPKDTPYKCSVSLTLVDIDANVEYKHNGHYYEERDMG